VDIEDAALARGLLGEGAQGIDDVGGDGEDDDLSGGEPEDGCREHASEGEHPGQAVPEDGAGDEEVHRLPTGLPEPRNVVAEHRVGPEEPDPVAGGGLR